MRLLDLIVLPVMLTVGCDDQDWHCHWLCWLRDVSFLATHSRKSPRAVQHVRAVVHSSKLEVDVKLKLVMQCGMVVSYGLELANYQLM